MKQLFCYDQWSILKWFCWKVEHILTHLKYNVVIIFLWIIDYTKSNNDDIKKKLRNKSSWTDVQAEITWK